MCGLGKLGSRKWETTGGLPSRPGRKTAGHWRDGYYAMMELNILQCHINDSSSPIVTCTMRVLRWRQIYKPPFALILLFSTRARLASKSLKLMESHDMLWN